ncbi:DUF5686 and carboxypeptidase-like regulatory domain-containing protein [Rhodohalobacter barkolensis]|uniref:Carboxypeptidase-like regulatory domain-containing protein n=1 Tax=Rhodohalobacter barkolensis TaxID=2053187 RepID=A0A2N0VFZ8_9BACT|nr:DUF5686 and carboxypeptidase-like regulatory domain-containing protein [Rhodohalobacter barkolensis]PKD43115.1 hypothetical protein CWD77_10835 [Rhodohalobacter barkolensis]
MRFRLISFTILLLLTPVYVFSQTEISGTIYDGQTGETLPAATVILENSLRGTISNEEGKYSIQVDQLPVTIRVSYIGYESFNVVVDENSPRVIDVRLFPSVTQMEEIVVTDRDPGLTIMERVIERKKLWRANLDSYQSEAYTRQILENDTSIVSITESSSTLYWQKGEGHREIQKSTRQTSNINADENFAGVRYLPNFYDDNVEIAGYNIVGITHPDALSYYHFKLLETLQMDGVPVYKIEVTPKRKLQPTFKGVAFVLGRQYALVDVDLKPNEVVNFPPPVQDFDLSYKQQFSNYGRDFWLPVDMRIEGRIRIGLIGLQFPAINFKQVSRISDYQVNVSIPDSIFNNQDTFTKADTTYKEEVTFVEIPLTDEERRAYETIDSTQTMEEAFRPEGFLARMLDDEEEERSGPLSGIGNLFPDGVGLRAKYNRVEGVHIGLNYQNEISNLSLNTKIFGGYSFNSETWDYGTNLVKQIATLDRISLDLHLQYQQTMDTQYQSNNYTVGMNSFVTLIGGDDYFNYFRNEQLGVGVEVKNILDKTDLKIMGRHEIHRSTLTDEVVDFRLFDWVNERRLNPGISEGTVRSVSAEIGYNVQERNFGFAGNRQILLKGEFSNSALGSDFDFSSLMVSIDWNFGTFYQRRLFANTLDIHLSGGTILGTPPIQKLGSIDGSLSRFTPFSILKTKPYTPYVGNNFGLAVAEHNFRTIPFEILGLNYFVEKGWGIILFGGAGFAEGTDEFSGLSMQSDGIHSEAGVSLNSIFGILRLDFAKRLDAPGYFFGFSVPRYF